VADLSTLREGDEVIAVGHPLGLGFSVTRGIVSCRARSFHGKVFIQTDAAINPGNSGGALLDTSGRLVGINTFLLQGQGLNFAIPIDRAVTVINEGMQSARLRKGKLVCPACQSITSSAKRYCESCGGQLGQTLLPSNPATFAKQAIAASVESTPPHCRACGKGLTGGTYCTVCGCSVVDRMRK